MAASTPTLLHPGEWHLPFVKEYEQESFTLAECKVMSVARTARISYNTHDGKHSSLENDQLLYDQLMGFPVHASPFEHQATPDKKWSRNRWGKPDLHGNIYGWIQHRKMIEGEAIHEY